MGFVVGSTFIIWLLVVIIALERDQQKLSTMQNSKFKKRSINNEK